MSDNRFIMIREKIGEFEISFRDADTGQIMFDLGSAPTLRKAIIRANKEQEEDPVEYGLVVKLREKNWRG